MTRRGPAVRRWVARGVALAAAAALTAVSVSAGPAGATPATWLDTTYGDHGVAVADNAHSTGEGIVDASGRAYFVTDDGAPQPTYTLHRLTAQGRIDPSFAGGAVTLPFVISGAANSLHADTGGTVTVLRANDVNGLQVVRYTTDGMLDPTFDGDGMATYLTSVPLQSPMAMVERGDGLLLLATGADDHAGYLIAITSTGALDPTWAPSTPTPGVLVDPRGTRLIAVDGDRIVGYRGTTGELVRYTGDGSLDPTFGDAGVVEAGDSFTALAVGDGAYYLQSPRAAAGSATPGIVRYLASGARDTSFGDGGTALGVAIRGDCSIEGSGLAGALTYVYLVSRCAGSGPVSVTRFTAGGELDTTFGDGGLVLLDERAGQPVAGGGLLGVQPNGRLLMVVDVPADGARAGWVGVVRLRNTAEGMAAAGSYVALAPARVLDTRDGTGVPAGPVPANGLLNLAVAGVGEVPARGVAAVVLTVTVTEPAADGYLTVYHTGIPTPLAANLSFDAGQTVSNLVTVKLGTGGSVSFANGSPGPVDLVADIAGYYRAGTPVEPGAFVPLGPARLLDTRAGAALAGNGVLDLSVAGHGGVPEHGAGAVVLTVTVTGPTAHGFITVHPGGTPAPPAPNLTFRAGQTASILVTTKLGADGSVSLTNAAPGPVHLVADVAGYYLAGTAVESGTFVPLDPVRLLDTRLGTAGPVGAHLTRDLTVAGTGGVPQADAVVLNVTVTAPGAAGYLTVFPRGSSVPVAANLNFGPGQTIPNLAIVKLSAGAVSVFNGSPAAAHIVADVAGYFLP